ncbi:MAG: hypothetical protein LJF30_12060 [Acidobacteria bacterium]|nr:hypothetical protein [Acidobacteriota bacterium]
MARSASTQTRRLRVVAGETVSVCLTEVVFALSGRLGERSAFTFQLPSSA